MTPFEAVMLLEDEDCEVSHHGFLEAFSVLVSTGLAWELQGRYGRAAKDLIERGYLDLEGNITQEAQEFLDEQ